VNDLKRYSSNKMNKEEVAGLLFCIYTPMHLRYSIRLFCSVHCNGHHCQSDSITHSNMVLKPETLQCVVRNFIYRKWTKTSAIIFIEAVNNARCTKQHSFEINAMNILLTSCL